MTAWKEFLQRYARLLGFGVLASFASNFGQTYFIALFNDPIRAEFGLSHGAFGGLEDIKLNFAGVAQQRPTPTAWSKRRDRCERQ